MLVIMPKIKLAKNEKYIIKNIVFGAASQGSLGLIGLQGLDITMPKTKPAMFMAMFMPIKISRKTVMLIMKGCFKTNSLYSVVKNYFTMLLKLRNKQPGKLMRCEIFAVINERSTNYGC